MSAAESPPLNIPVTWVNSHVCSLCLNGASATQHKRNPGRHRPCRAIFHQKQAPACLLAECDQVSRGRVTLYTLGHESLAFLAAPLTVPDSLLLGNAHSLGPFSMQLPHYLLFHVFWLPVEPGFSEWNMHILRGICRAIGQIQHYCGGAAVGS